MFGRVDGVLGKRGAESAIMFIIAIIYTKTNV